MVVDKLLRDKRVDPSANDNAAIRNAHRNGHEDVVKRLRQDPRTMTINLESPPLTNQPQETKKLVVRKASDLEKFPDFETIFLNHDPLADNAALQLAAKQGDLEKIKQLINHPRIDPGADYNEAIKVAAEHGHLAVVDVLLKDERVEPSDDNNAAIRAASENGHVSVVDRLMRDPRVDPAAKNNAPVRTAYANGHVEVVMRLQKDSRVQLEPSPSVKM